MLFFKWGNFLFVKILMDIQWFKVHFRAIFSSFYYIRSSTQASHQKSLKIYFRTLYSIYNDMNEDFFFVKIPMRTPFDSIFLHRFFSVRVSGPGRYPNENLFLYDQISSYMILLKWGNFFVSNLLWVYKGLKFIFERFFRLFWSGSKVDSKWI